ncbi:hypothetical protein KFK09_023660 [Dendrobium nobile]|uniref:CCHC-type domain-containing protein n=1 Tax=Dendrobium nobile TaxID=94219 RepID=A0A8T3ACM1_DENNO|nr:hypothetical protein KFK09_023660 [Dendrobium nobile]
MDSGAMVLDTLALRRHGSMAEDNGEISNLAVNFFQCHLNKHFYPTGLPNPSFIPQLVSDEDNVLLTNPPSLEELKDVLFGMNDNSVAGPDGNNDCLWANFMMVKYCGRRHPSLCGFAMVTLKFGNVSSWLSGRLSPFWLGGLVMAPFSFGKIVGLMGLSSPLNVNVVSMLRICTIFLSLVRLLLSCITWMKPSSSSVKMNVASANLGNSLGFGGVLRYHNGSFICSFVGPVAWGDINLANFVGVFHSLQLCINLNLSVVVLETDFDLRMLRSLDDFNCSSILFYTLRDIRASLNLMHCDFSTLVTSSCFVLILLFFGLCDELAGFSGVGMSFWDQNTSFTWHCGCWPGLLSLLGPVCLSLFRGCLHVVCSSWNLCGSLIVRSLRISATGSILAFALQGSLYMAAEAPSSSWGKVSEPVTHKNKGFFNLEGDVSLSPSRFRSFKEVLSGKTSAGDELPSLTQSTFNGVPAVLLSDEEVLKLAYPFKFTLADIHIVPGRSEQIQIVLDLTQGYCLAYNFYSSDRPGRSHDRPGRSCPEIIQKTLQKSAVFHALIGLDDLNFVLADSGREIQFREEHSDRPGRSHDRPGRSCPEIIQKTLQKSAVFHALIGLDDLNFVLADSGREIQFREEHFYSVGLLDSRHVAIQLSNDLDYSRIFARRSYFIFNCQMRILKWTPFFDIKEESPIVPMWISFPNLRLHFFNHQVLHALGLIFGRPLQTDQATASHTRPFVSRILVEIDISKNHPKEIWVGSKTLGYFQKVEFDNVPDFCFHCKMHGHAQKDCFVLHPELKKSKVMPNGKLESADSQKIYVPVNNVSNDHQENTEKMVEPQPIIHNLDTIVSEPNNNILTYDINASVGADNTEIHTSPALNDTIANNSFVNVSKPSDAEPSFFVSIASMFNEVENDDLIVSNAPPVILNNQFSLLKNNIREECEDGEFVPHAKNLSLAISNRENENAETCNTGSTEHHDGNFTYVSKKKVNRLNIFYQLLLDLQERKLLLKLEMIKALLWNVRGIGGDFNIISNVSERVGGNPPNANAIDDFNSMISDCRLNDIGYFGSPFTWNKANMWQRLDKILFNDNWIAQFSLTNIEHLSRTLSDHSPLLLNINRISSHFSFSFRFQNMWMLHADFSNLLSPNWNAPVYPDNNIAEAESNVSNLEMVYQQNSNAHNLSSLNQAKDSLLLLQCQEECFWNQKSNAKFIVEGDRNTKFFHALANKKKTRSHIHKIFDANGVAVSTDEAICDSGVNYFKNIFNSSSNCLPITNPHVIPKLISDDDNLLLSQIPSEEEIFKVINDLKSNAVSGPDGFTTKFFQNNWAIIKEDVINAVKDFFSDFPVSHLSFADDFILFTNGSINNVSLLINFLTNFYNQSGLAINKDKSTFIVSNSVNHDRMQAIQRICGFQSRALPITYLGTPIYKGHICNLIPILIVWFIWRARNDAKHNGIKMDAMIIIFNVKHKISQLHSHKMISKKNFRGCYQLALNLGINFSDIHVNSADLLVTWIKPKPPYIKLNSDGSIGPNGAGAGGIIRDVYGDVIAAFSAPICCTSVITAELHALNLGLKICANKGFNCIWIEVDAMLLIQIIKNTVHGNPQIFYLIRKIKMLLSNVIYSISHIFREANTCADWLAKRGCNISLYEELDPGDLHPILHSMIMMDKTGLPYIRYG